MADDFTPIPPPRSNDPLRALNFDVRRFWLEHGGAKFGLEPRAFVLGRGSTCDLVVGDGRASRRHARLVVKANSVTIEDLESSNGVFVNGKRIAELYPLEDGDQFQIGSAAFILKSELLSCRNPSSPTPATSPGGSTLAELGAELSRDEAEAPTVEAHSLDLLATLADKSLTLGRAEEAERMLASTLDDVLRRAGAGRAATLPSRVFAKAAHYAVLLADATQRGSWVDYAVSLFDALGQPLPATVVDQLYVTVRKLTDVDRVALRSYVERLRNRPNSTPADRFVIQRLAGLERLVSLK
jgi:pSer/pThr/pTyr-binding forkhead associated (FHA) protein